MKRKEKIVGKDFVVRQYRVENCRSSGNFRIAFLSDLHNRSFGVHQEKLLEALRAFRPDAVLLGGDIIDEGRNADASMELLHQISGWPAFYVSGNHEERTGKLRQIKREIRSMGIEVLEGDVRRLEIRGCPLLVGGLDDPGTDEEGYYRQLGMLEQEIRRTQREQIFRILIQHRPERVREYRPLGFDLMLAGHAHGGQWRIPGLINGVYAPGQGLFPRYAGGSYSFGNQTLIVGRGLAGSARGIPRICNPPELVTAEIKNRKEGR